MKDLKDAIKEAGLKTDFGLTEIGKFDPLCINQCSESCSKGCSESCAPRCISSVKGDPQQ
jgi:hypothetical protein